MCRTGRGPNCHPSVARRHRVSDAGKPVQRASDLVLFLLVFAYAVAFPAFAQERDKVLVLTPSDRPIVKLLTKALQSASTLGGAPGRNVGVDVRVQREGQTEQDMVRQLLPTTGRYRAVFATTMALARAMQVEDGATPIVFEGGADPLSMCLVDSLKRPGRNATGYIHHLPNIGGKMMESLVDAFPAVRRIYYVVSAQNVFPSSCEPRATEDRADIVPCVAGFHQADSYLRRRANPDAIMEQAAKRGLEVKFVLMCSRADFRLLGTLGSDLTDVGFVVPWHGLFSLHAQELVDIISQSRHPAIYGLGKFSKMGGVMSIEPIRNAGDDQVPVDMLLQVLDGRAPATLPIQMPRGFRLTVNAAAAAAQGLRPGLNLLRRADEVIVSTKR